MVETPSYDFFQVLSLIPRRARLSSSIVYARGTEEEIEKFNSKWKSYIVERKTSYLYSLSGNTHIVYIYIP